MNKPNLTDIKLVTFFTDMNKNIDVKEDIKPTISYNNKTIFIPFQSSPPPKKLNKKHKSNKTDYNENWEEATIEDLETGKYEII